MQNSQLQELKVRIEQELKHEEWFEEKEGFQIVLNWINDIEAVEKEND